MHSNPRNILTAALFAAIGVVLPIGFHFVGMGGKVFLPMHIPVLMAGLLLGPIWGLLVGAATPVLSALLTGMPPLSPPIMPIMLGELAVYGWLCGLAHHRWGWNPYGALLFSMAGGRVAAGLVVWLFGKLLAFKLPVVAYLIGAVVTGLPGIMLQILVIPPFIRLLARIRKAGAVNYESPRVF